MLDPRMKKLADVLVSYSCKVQPGERVLIDAFDIPAEMACALIDRVAEAGGVPFCDLYQARVMRSFVATATQEQMALYAQRGLDFMKQCQCYIAVRGGHNITEMSDVPDERMKTYRSAMKPVTDQRVKHSKWVVLRWPTPSMAQLAGMSTEQFENFFFDVCTLDYARMAKAEDILKERMERTDRVRLVGPGETDLAFSIKGMAAIPCVGDRNIPDGECYTAPLRDSANGVIVFNAGTIHDGKPFDNIRLEFQDGKAVNATASDTKALNEILDIDEGARYIGEFSLGFNPHINRAMRDILFDEKIAGSIHLALGQAYDEADNGNRSKNHWDLVMIQTEPQGGGEIWFDDELIRKAGRFVPEYLHPLNPENLV
ncbi:MAG: aminopeptidase [Planctomycetaceae bacterium]|nr:aminopeptidase [Planctomycetaceae bacterium]